MDEKDKIYVQKFMAFSVRIVQLCKYLNEKKNEYVLAKQILRSGTSIGANHREAIYAETDLDFMLLKATNYISKEQFDSLYTDAEEIMKMLTSSILTAKRSLNH